MVGPFIFLDHAGPVEKFPGNITSLDVLPHPHIGLSTITYLFKGKVTHRDSLGVEQVIQPGEVNWMTAGKGISHSERFENPEVLEKNGLEMLQTWVALPESVEECDPTFNNYQPHQLPVHTDTGIWMRLVAGTAYGLNNDVAVHSPLFYLHMKLEAGAKIDLPTEHSERAIYIADGRLEIAGTTYSSGQMIVFSKNEEATVRAETKTEYIMLGGEPLGERFIWWNFVSSRQERIEQAKHDWKSGKITLPQGDDEEFIPLPESRMKPASSDVPPPEPLS